MAILNLTPEISAVEFSGDQLVLKSLGNPPRARLRSEQLPLTAVDRVLVHGNCSLPCDTFLRFMKHRIPVLFFRDSGQFLGTMDSGGLADARKRQLQYKLSSDPVRCKFLIGQLIYAKLCNSRRVLLRLSGTRRELTLPAQIQAASVIKLAARRVRLARFTVDQLRGYEGLGAAAYFRRLADFMPENFPLTKRSYHPARDEVNALMSFSYSVALSEIISALRRHNLDIYQGFFHVAAPGVPALAYDLLEPFRAPLCDLVVLHLLNHHVIRREHFAGLPDSGGFHLTSAGKQLFFRSFDRVMRRKFKLRMSKNHVDFRQVIEQQCLLLLKYLEGETDCNFFLMP